MPTASPMLTEVARAPLATTIPAPSWPPTTGVLRGRGQSFLRAWRSVWQTPEKRIWTRAWSGAGLGTGIFLKDTAGC